MPPTRPAWRAAGAILGARFPVYVGSEGNDPRIRRTDHEPPAAKRQDRPCARAATPGRACPAWVMNRPKASDHAVVVVDIPGDAFV